MGVSIIADMIFALSFVIVLIALLVSGEKIFDICYAKFPIFAEYCDKICGFSDDYEEFEEDYDDNGVVLWHE